MNANDLLNLIGKARDNHILEAAATQPQQKRLSRNRIVLVAVIAALSLLLVGCAAVYFWMQDMAIGTETYTKTHDDQGKALEEPIEVERQVLTFAGYSDSATNQAAREWYAFRESYDPDHALMTNDPDLPDIENNYEWVYGCYTTEMVAKLDEIVAKYDVKLLGEWVPIQRWQSDVALENIGVTSLLKEGAEAEMGNVSGMLYPPYNYALEFDLTLTGEDAAWTKTVWANGYYYHKDYLPSDGTWHLDMDSYEQWNYTTSDGLKLLLAMNKTGNGFIICEREEGFQVVAISGNRTGSAYPTEDQVPGKKALEQMAEVFDFTFTPKEINKEAMQPALDAAEAEYQAENAYVPEVYSGYEDYLREMCLWFDDNMCYVYHDLDDDGEEELLLARHTDEGPHLQYQLTMKDGQVVEQLWDHYLYEGNVTMIHYMGDHSAYERWEFWKPVFPLEENDNQFLGYVVHNPDGTWQMTTEYIYPYEDAPTVTQAEAEAFLNQFTPVELSWQPLNAYPLSDGTTIGDYKASLDKTLSKEELHKFYADWWQERKDRHDRYTHYRILDVNNDGVDDLLLSGSGDFYWVAWTYGYGEIQPLFANDIYLCENGVLENVSTCYEEPGIEIEEHEFFTLDGNKRVVLDYICYNKSTASWQTDLDGTTITEAEAQAILAKYPRIDQGMRPISELTGE